MLCICKKDYLSEGNALQCIEPRENTIYDKTNVLPKLKEGNKPGNDLALIEVESETRILEDETLELDTGHILEGNSYIFTLVDKVEKTSFPLTITQDNYNKAKLLSYRSYDLQNINFVDQKYILTRNFAKGNFGEVWFARGRLKKAVGFVDPVEEDFVLKRVFCEKGVHHRESGRREIYFGQKIQKLGSSKLTRFVESFQNSDSDSLWIVFKNEGKSLDKLLYEQNFNLLQSSQFWNNLRTTIGGKSLRKEIMRQTLEALEVLLKHSIIHRDIKPSNIFLSISTSGELNLKLGDFGSAIDLTNDLYFPLKPTNLEETVLYQPPEARISSGAFPYFSTETLEHVTQMDGYDTYHSFDVWSAGIVFLEMFFGFPDFFILTDKIRKRVEVDFRRNFKGRAESLSDGIKDKAYFKAILEDCGISEAQPSKEKLRRLVDSLNMIKTDEMIEEELDLIYQMLQFKPEMRWNVTRLLQHSYFA